MLLRVGHGWATFAFRRRRRFFLFRCYAAGVCSAGLSKRNYKASMQSMKGSDTLPYENVAYQCLERAHSIAEAHFRKRLAYCCTYGFRWRFGNYFACRLERCREFGVHRQSVASMTARACSSSIFVVWSSRGSWLAIGSPMPFRLLRRPHAKRQGIACCAMPVAAAAVPRCACAAQAAFPL